MKLNVTKIVLCGCSHSAQDQMHGQGMRVTTPVNTQQAKDIMAVRCTVCGRVHVLGKTQ